MAKSSAGSDILLLAGVAVAGFIAYKIYEGYSNSSMGGADFGTAGSSGGADSFGSDAAPTATASVANNVFAVMDAL